MCVHAIPLDGQGDGVSISASIRSRYIEVIKDKTEGATGGNWKDKEKEKEKEKEKSPVLMMLSDGCIEDMSSMLFTTVVANLSVIVGHDIDGQPLPLPSSSSHIQPTILERLQRTLDPLDFLGRGGQHYYLSFALYVSFYYNSHLFPFSLIFPCYIASHNMSSHDVSSRLLHYIISHHITSHHIISYHIT